jgi:hypothetical protein
VLLFYKKVTMETIKENEVVLAPGCLDQEIKNGCIEEDECMEL